MTEPPDPPPAYEFAQSPFAYTLPFTMTSCALITTDPLMSVPYPLVFLLNWAREIAALLLVVGRGRRLRGVGGGSLANLVTHPALWFGLPFVKMAWWSKLAIAEVAIVAVEAVILWFAMHGRGCTRLRALGTSLVANGASFALTFVVRF